MRTRLAVLASLAVLHAQLPPTMFSPWYAEAMRGILQIEPADAVRLEQQLSANPTDFPARLQLMAYHQRADRAANPEDRAKRLNHTFWLVEHHPSSELLHSPVSRFTAADLSPAELRRAAQLWEAAPPTTATLWNAASFYQDLDPQRHLYYLEATAAADPNHPYALRPLAHLYATAVVQGGPSGARAQTALDASRNVWVLGNAAHTLHSFRRAQLAERYFLRAQQIDPTLKRDTILPPIRPAGEQPREDWQARFDEAVPRIRRLTVEAFPQLPTTIAATLGARHCTVPQPTPAGSPRNVIRGDFFSPGQPAWAVLCSVNDATSLLVFRDANDADPHVLNTQLDRLHLQSINDNQVGYSREITAVGRDFIVTHYRSYGGPEPPSIDHQGVDDAFLGKASMTWYFHQGRWRQLQGAD